MTDVAAASPGLRERKKLQLRRGLQRVALRLFAAQGYDDTTVEQIVTEAESSLATFYRHFPTKEDVVLYDEFGPLIEQAIAGRPASEPVTDTIRAAVAVVAQAVEADRYWADHDGTRPLTTLTDEAVTTFEPLLRSLQAAGP